MDKVDQYIYDFLRSERFNDLLRNVEEVEFPVTLTYAIERLLVTHVKLFMLEDQVRDKNLSDEEIGQIKRKIDYWNGVQRPRLISALGRMMAEAIMEDNRDIIEEPNLKDYKAR
jgi:hypothetical protein